MIKVLLAKESSLANARSVNGRTPLHYAAYRSHKKTVILLIAKGAKVNVKNDHDQTPLKIASIMGHKEIVDLLIAKAIESDRRKENLDDTHLVKRHIKKEKDQVRYCLISPQKGDEAFFSQTERLWK